jgi:hypothetical protein
MKLMATDGLTRRTLLGGAAAGAVGLTVGRWVVAAPAGAVVSLRTTETYVALRDAVVRLDRRGAATAAARFESWWVGQDEHMRRHVRRVFHALDHGERGSFASATRDERARLLERWTHPSADPLSDKSATERLSLGLGAMAIASAPEQVTDVRAPLI